jgi:two-component system OmpR family sensor kinase/two-component system sensor histidine kinase QseC
VATATVVGYLTYNETLEQNKRLIDAQLRQTALSLRDQGMVDDWQPDFLDDEKNDVVVQIWTNNGNLLYASDPGVALPARATMGFENVQAGAQQWRVYSMKGRDRIIQVAQPYQMRHEMAASSALYSLRPLIAFAPLMALLVWLTVGNALRPLRRLEREVTSRGARSLNSVSEAGLPSEIVPVVHALNALLGKLKQAFAGQRAFVADAAHELRSPLTALKLQLHLLENASDEADKKIALRNLNDGVDRASRMIEQLLTAARTEYSETTYCEAPVDIAEMMRRVIADLFPLAQSRNIDLGLDAPDALVIPGDTGQIYILIRNLLDNAVRYTPENGTVQARIEDKARHVCLTIDDSGPGIPPSERKRVFRRFYRAPGTTQSGNGLGLAIVKNIIIQHQATIDFSDSPLGGLQVQVCFRVIYDKAPVAQIHDDEEAPVGATDWQLPGA